MISIDLCKNLPDSECENMELELDEVTISIIEKTAAITGKSFEQTLEDALLHFLSTLQEDYTPEV